MNDQEMTIEQLRQELESIDTTAAMAAEEGLDLKKLGLVERRDSLRAELARREAEPEQSG
jgi:hypothetical protein